MTVAAAELLLEGLAAHRKISRAESGAYRRPTLSGRSLL
jgi:hypothetical protein